MRNAYRFLAGLIALEVVIQAMVMVFAVAGLGKWVEEGGVLDKAAFESGETLFPEMVGFIVHGMNGMFVMPLLALLLLIVSFFARVPGGIKWAAAVLGLVVLQIVLGLVGHAIPAVGGLHGINALVLFSAAVLAARRARELAPAAAGVDTRVPTAP
jgi:hypothetical protein